MSEPAERSEIEPPPVVKTWARAYAIVLAWLVVVILLLALFTRTFS